MFTSVSPDTGKLTSDCSMSGSNILNNDSQYKGISMNQKPSQVQA